MDGYFYLVKIHALIYFFLFDQKALGREYFLSCDLRHEGSSMF